MLSSKMIKRMNVIEKNLETTDIQLQHEMNIAVRELIREQFPDVKILPPLVTGNNRSEYIRDTKCLLNSIKKAAAYY